MPSQPAPWTVYNKALAPLKFGYALWEPGPIYSYRRVRPGDVGYIRRGRFHLLFSAGIPLGSRVLGTDVPLTFEPLDVGPLIMPSEVRPPGHLRTSTVRQIGADVGGSVAVAHTVEPGVKIAFELTNKQGAALITKHLTYREDAEREPRFVKYTKQHYESWVDFAREHDHSEDAKPILVTGVDLTREFAMVAYSDKQSRMECEFSTALPGLASASVSVWGSWHTLGLVHTNCGPHPTRRSCNSSGSSALESEIPDEYTQCVFIRYYTIRKRLFLPTVIKAGAGPHQLPEGDHEGDISGEGELFVDDPTEFDYPETGSPGGALDEVIHNVPADDRDSFDIVSEFIFQRSNAKSVILHHDDIEDFLQGDEEELIRLLTESGIAERIEVDENGVGHICSPLATGHSKLNPSDSKTGEDTHRQILPVSAAPVFSFTRQNISVEATKTQGPKGRDNTLSSLNGTIEALDLAEENTSIAPAKTAFGSVSALVTAIRDSTINDHDYVELGLSCAVICRVLYQGINERGLGDLSQSTCEAINHFTATVAEIQSKVISERGQSANSRPFHAKNDSVLIPAWKLDLKRIFRVFNTELGVTHERGDYDPAEDKAPSDNWPSLLGFVDRVSVAPPAVDGGFEHPFDHSPPASSDGLPDQESKSRSRATSVSSHDPSSIPIEGFEWLKFDSPYRKTTLLPVDKPPSLPSSVVPDVSPSTRVEHFFPTIPISRGVPVTIPFFNNPAETSTPPTRDMEAATWDVTSFHPSPDNVTSVNPKNVLPSTGPQSQVHTSSSIDLCQPMFSDPSPEPDFLNQRSFAQKSWVDSRSLNPGTSPTSTAISLQRALSDSGRASGHQHPGSEGGISYPASAHSEAVDLRFPYHTEVFSHIDRDHRRRSSSSSRDRGVGGMGLPGAPGSFRSSPYPSPNVSSPFGHDLSPSITDTPSLPTTATVGANERRRKRDAKFACPVPGCGSAFTRHFILKIHMRSHDKGKLFQCKLSRCGKRFTRAHDCKRHEQLHSEHKHHLCRGCSKSFSRADALRRHLRSGRGRDCQKAQDKVQANSMIDSAGLSSANSMGSGAGSSVAMDLNNIASTDGGYCGSVEAEPEMGDVLMQ